MTEASTMLEIQPVLGRAVAQVLRHYPTLDREELLGEVQPVALRAVRAFTPVGGRSLRSWVGYVVLSHLWAGVRSDNWRRRHSRQVCQTLTLELPQPHHFDLRQLVCDVSEEAAQVLQLVCEEGYKKTALVKLLRAMRWEGEEIARVFLEVKEALE